MLCPSGGRASRMGRFNHGLSTGTLFAVFERGRLFRRFREHKHLDIVYLTQKCQYCHRVYKPPVSAPIENCVMKLAVQSSMPDPCAPFYLSILVRTSLNFGPPFGPPFCFLLHIQLLFSLLPTLRLHCRNPGCTLCLKLDMYRVSQLHASTLQARTQAHAYHAE